MNSFQREIDTPEFVGLAELASEIVLDIPKCTDLMVRKALQSIYREFCRETHTLALRKTVSLNHGARYYPVQPFAGGAVVAVNDVAVNGIRNAAVVHLNPAYIEISEYFANAAPHCHPHYTLAYTIVEVPRIGCERAPMWFIEKYGDALVSGTLAKLFSASRRPWSDAQLAAQHLLRYENGKSEARMHEEFPHNGNCIDMSMTL